MKLVNLIGSIITGLGWVAAIVLSAIGSSSNVQALVMLAGFSMMALWAFNIAGIIIGIMSCVKDIKSLIAALGLASHAIQLVLTVGLTLVGIFVK